MSAIRKARHVHATTPHLNHRAIGRQGSQGVAVVTCDVVQYRAS